MRRRAAGKLQIEKLLPNAIEGLLGDCSQHLRKKIIAMVKSSKNNSNSQFESERYHHSNGSGVSTLPLRCTCPLLH